MDTFATRIVGVRPMLHHAPNSIGQKTTRGKKEYLPEEEAEKALYRNSYGRIVQPMLHVLRAMEKTASDFKASGKKTFKAYILAGLSISPFEIPLLDADTGEEPKYELDARPVTVNRARIMRVRPRFDRWALEFTMEILDAIITPAIAREILEAAGKYQGLGDYRPLFGLFEVEKFERIEAI